MRTRRREKEEETEETEEEARESRRAKTRRSLRRRHHSARAERVMMIFSFWSLCDESDFSSRVVPGRSPLLRVRFPFAVLDFGFGIFFYFFRVQGVETKHLLFFLVRSPHSFVRCTRTNKHHASIRINDNSDKIITRTHSTTRWGFVGKRANLH
jgi:hypothetical protein